MPEVTLTTLFGNNGYTAAGYSGDYRLANQNSFTFSFVRYTQDQGPNPSNKSAFRLILDNPPDAIVSANITGFFTQGFPQKNCAPPGGWNCSQFTPVNTGVFGPPSINAAGKVFFPLKKHDGGAYARAAAKCPCNTTTKSRELYAQVGVQTVGGGAYVLIVDLIPCTNCDAVRREVSRRKRRKPEAESSALVKRIGKSFDLLRAWNDYEI